MRIIFSLVDNSWWYCMQEWVVLLVLFHLLQNQRETQYFCWFLGISRPWKLYDLQSGLVSYPFRTVKHWSILRFVEALGIRNDWLSSCLKYRRIVPLGKEARNWVQFECESGTTVVLLKGSFTTFMPCPCHPFVVGHFSRPLKWQEQTDNTKMYSQSMTVAKTALSQASDSCHPTHPKQETSRFTTRFTGSVFLWEDRIVSNSLRKKGVFRFSYV